MADDPTHPGAQRRWLSRELHDVLGFRLTVVALHAAAAERDLTSSEDGQRALRLIRENATEALRELRTILQHIDGESEPPSSGPHLDVLDRMVATAGEVGLDVDLRVGPNSEALEPDVSAAAVGIVREALTNALRHGQASGGRVALMHQRDVVMVEVADNGQGRPLATPAAARVSGGRGLRGLAERAAELGGALEFGPRHGGGFVVRAHLPHALRGGGAS
jgi:signal transduction histidine kinase